ncbi:hypothetical protein C7B65_07280 [Phormidesmis priestleyi ULC007]|uniref:Uncharacterized protein n=1 Tax=Phormidesmis priestleyi ULC007 TaxID=1920490 RepID=A0A2T1DJQ5_9CYAN|nr:hypothetical protein [Phormidesmis priestleyi]PSB20691.1 hypothetical protein C7B65_07280 [Phormidesmis priestleyi ULC007]PZO47114.1 MAG: hypothetical protein DCF14_20745 [Phormidesmis priestleyi]
MTRNSNDLSATEKVKVALDCLHRELSGDANASKTVAQKYDLSTRSVTTLKNQALEILQKGFNPSTPVSSAIAASINDKALDQALNLLLNTSTTRDVHTEEPESEREDADGITIDEVFAAIVDYNKSKKEPPLYISQGILQKISGQSVAEVKLWFAKHEQEVNQHNEKYELTPITNRRLKRGFDYKAELGLEEEE